MKDEKEPLAETLEVAFILYPLAFTFEPLRIQTKLQTNVIRHKSHSPRESLSYRRMLPETTFAPSSGFDPVQSATMVPYANGFASVPEFAMELIERQRPAYCCCGTERKVRMANLRVVAG
jgi:hypothetical protein